MIKYNKDVISILKNSEKEMYELNDPSVRIDHFILAVLKSNTNIKNLLNKNNINYNNYKNRMKKNISDEKNSFIFYSLNLKKILDLAYDTANRYSSNEITLEHIFITLLDENIELNILEELKLNLESFYKDIIKLTTTSSNTLVQDIGINLTKEAKNNKLNKVIGREKEIKEVIEILARKNKNNPILIGEAGVGKTAIVEELANMIANNEVPEFLKSKEIISINVSSIISGTKYRGEFEEKLNKILKECENNDNIILFIDEIHTIVGAGGAEGAIDASNILKPSLARGYLKVIGATTINEYKKSIVTDKALDRRFQKVFVNIPNIDETYNILKNIKHDYEKFHNVSISDKLLKKVIELSNKYILDRNNPDKSIDILDEACAATNVNENKDSIDYLYKKLNKIQTLKKKSIENSDYQKASNYKEKEQNILNEINKNLNKKKEVKIDTIISIIESKCNSKIYDIENDKIYDYLKDNLNKKVIGHNKEINNIIDRLKLLSNKKDNLPISFLINGSTGVGKTLFAIELSKLLNKNLIKLNMNEYENEISINKIIGSPQGYVGYNDNNTVLEDLKLNPNSIILIDDIEKAHPLIINLFSKILEEGILKNSKNEIINFKNAIIIITSNLKECNPIGYIKNNQHSGNLNKELTSNINYIVNFNKLNESNIKEIIKLNLDEFNYNYNTNINLNKEDLNTIINSSLYELNGAKNIKNLIKNHIENLLISTSL